MEKFKREKKILAEFCQTQGLHHSDKREAVLEALLDEKHHQTSEDLLRYVVKRGTAVDPKTVQSALELMVGAGLAREVRLEDGTVVYEHSFAHRHHDHLICRQCGRMVEFTNPELEKLQDDIAAAHGFVVEDHSLSMYGVCKSCTGKAKIVEPEPLSPGEREKLVALTKLKPGQHGVVREIAGGEGVAKRLAAMGIRPGKRVTKVSAMLMGGPVVVSIDRRQLALGHGMAHKILVDAS